MSAIIQGKDWREVVDRSMATSRLHGMKFTVRKINGHWLGFVATKEFMKWSHRTSE